MMTKRTLISIEDLLTIMGYDMDEISGLPSYERVAEYESIANRELSIMAVEDMSVGYIRDLIIKWNKADNAANIPINERKPIKLYIDSDGGMLLPAMNLIDIMKVSKTPVWTIGLSRCCSAGGLILMSGHRRFIYPNTIFLLHEGSTGSVGSTSKVFDNVEFQKQYEAEKLTTWILTHSKITAQEYKEKYRYEWYMMAEDVIKYGLADEILTEII